MHGSVFGIYLCNWNLHNFELCENGIIFGWFRLKTYFGEITTSDWIVIQHSDHSWFNGTEIKWGQIYLIFIDIGVKKQFLNFNIAPLCQ